MIDHSETDFSPFYDFLLNLQSRPTPIDVYLELQPAMLVFVSDIDL